MSEFRFRLRENSHYSKRLIPVAVILGLALYMLYAADWHKPDTILPSSVVSANSEVDETTVTNDQINEHTVSSDEPRYINIPKISVDNTRVYGVSVDNNNILQVPNNIHDAGWYKNSAKPGSGKGALLVDAHNGGITRDGVFAKLGTLQPGDEISIERGDGEVFYYKVIDVRDKDLNWVNNAGMKEMMYSADPAKEGLNLITCSGKWNPDDKTYDRRVLVRATLTR